MKQPRQLGRYYLTTRIARGGMAEVYRAKTAGVMGFLKDVAVKLILPEVLAESDPDDILGMFVDEAHIAGSLEHPNIVRVLDLCEEHGEFYMAMDYIAGQNTRSMLAQESPLPPCMVAYIMAEICGALGYLHRKTDAEGQPRNIVHRDISPPNILVSYEGEVKLIDFGVAKADNQLHVTADGALKGKYAYMSPEQTKSDPLDLRSDIFSLGTVMYELLTGCSPFRDKNVLLTLQNVAQAPLHSPRSLRPEIPPALNEIVMRAMARPREARFDSAYEMQDALYRFLHAQTTRMSRHHIADWMAQTFAQEILAEQRNQEAYAPYFASLQRRRAQPPPPPTSRGRPSASHDWGAGGGSTGDVGAIATTNPRNGVALHEAQRASLVGEKPSYSGPFPYPDAPHPVQGQVSYTGPAPVPNRQALQASSQATSYAGPRPKSVRQDAQRNMQELTPSSYVGPRPGQLHQLPTSAPVHTNAHRHAPRWEGDQAANHTAAYDAAYDDDFDLDDEAPTVMMPPISATNTALSAKTTWQTWALIAALVLGVMASGALAFWGWSQWHQPQAKSLAQPQCQLQVNLATPAQALRARWGTSVHNPERLTPHKWHFPALACGAQWLMLERPGHRPLRRYITLRAGTTHHLHNPPMQALTQKPQK